MGLYPESKNLRQNDNYKEEFNLLKVFEMSRIDNHEVN